MTFNNAEAEVCGCRYRWTADAHGGRLEVYNAIHGHWFTSAFSGYVRAARNGIAPSPTELPDVTPHADALRAHFATAVTR